MVNKVILIGNVGADPEVRALEGGVKVARLRIATSERIYNRTTQEAKDHTEWHSITLWRNLADVADRFIRKGTQVYIEGRLRSRDWTDKDGIKRYAVDIVADELKLLGGRPKGAGAPADGTSYGAQTADGGGYFEGGVPVAPAVPRAEAAPVQVVDTPSDDIDDLPF